MTIQWHCGTTTMTGPGEPLIIDGQSTNMSAAFLGRFHAVPVGGGRPACSQKPADPDMGDLGILWPPRQGRLCPRCVEETSA